MRFGVAEKVVLSVVLTATVFPVSEASADEAEVHYRMCLVHKQAGRMQQALEECRVATRLRPSHAAAHFSTGTIQRREGLLEPALRSFRRAAELQPQNANSHGMVGAVLIRLRRYDQAIEPLRRACELEPDEASNWANLGMAYRRLRRNEDAMRAYQAGLERAPEDAQLLNNLAVVYRRERMNEQAIVLLTQALEQTANENNHEIHLNLAITLRAATRYDEAIPHYVRALALGARGEGPLFDLAVCYEQVGQYALALETYERFVAEVASRDPAAAQRARDTMERLRQRL